MSIFLTRAEHDHPPHLRDHLPLRYILRLSVNEIISHIYALCASGMHLDLHLNQRNETHHLQNQLHDHSGTKLQSNVFVSNKVDCCNAGKRRANQQYSGNSYPTLFTCHNGAG